MKILIIGCTGQLGSYLTRDVQALGEVITPVHTELDITSTLSVDTFLSNNIVDLIINTSAFHLVDQAEKDWQRAFDVNTLAVRSLARSARKINAKFMTISTDYVFDGMKNEPYNEFDIPNPMQVYGASKFSGECLALAENANTYVIRTAGLFGSHGSRQKGGNFILNRLEDAKTKNNISISGNMYSSITYAGDLSVVICEMIRRELPYGIYHAANTGYESWADYTRKIYMFTGKKTVVEDNIYVNTTIKRPLFSVLKNSKLESNNIIMPSWEEGLEKYLNELK